jgi:hypothetical protein
MSGAMTDIHEDLLTVLDAVQIESPTRYCLLGEPSEVPGRDPAGSPDRTESERLVSALANALYARLYIRPSPPPLPPADELARRDLVAALSAANSGRGTWEAGWTVRHIEEGGPVVVARDEVAFRVPATGLRVRADAIRPGMSCRVRVPKELRRLVPGFYAALGDGEEPPADDAGLEPAGRYYWHLTPEAAVPFLAMATALLNGHRIPFLLKVPSDPDGYHRADAGVLFFRRRDRAGIDPLAARIHSAIAHGLRPDVPLFTRRLADGLGHAEDPGGSRSFGEHRCRLVAEALWHAFTRGEVDRPARAAALRAAFLREGLDPLRPHLGPGWTADGDPEPWMTTAARPGPGGAARMSGAPRGSMSPQEAAIGIGRRLCRAAYWDGAGQLCNWMGHSQERVAELGGALLPTTAALGPDLYGGSAGIALFLGHLHALAGDDELRRTALGGIAHAIRQLDRSPPRQPLAPLSFFSGSLGVAYAAWSVGTATGHAELAAAVESILDRIIAAASSSHPLDVIGGNAGAIPVLLAMGQVTGLERYRDLAIALGEELLRAEPPGAAARTGPGNRANGLASRESPSSGLAHGAAGIGLALFELHAVTGRLDFREAARRSVTEEDTLFDPHRGNWAESHDPSESARFPRAWCHGAPGIALARLRAAALDPHRRDDYLARARAAIATTLAAIEYGLTSPRGDATPCHGLAGLIEIVAITGQMLDEPSYRERALAAARVLIDRHAATGDWPTGLDSGSPHPGLMIGTAGIGSTLLRLQAPERVPSVLLFIPEPALVPSSRSPGDRRGPAAAVGDGQDLVNSERVG